MTDALGSRRRQEDQFSELFEKALREGPQRVSRRGKEEVVVVAARSFDQLQRRRRGFIELLGEAPLDELEMARERSAVREVDP